MGSFRKFRVARASSPAGWDGVPPPVDERDSHRDGAGTRRRGRLRYTCTDVGFVSQKTFQKSDPVGSLRIWSAPFRQFVNLCALCVFVVGMVSVRVFHMGATGSLFAPCARKATA